MSVPTIKLVAWEDRTNHFIFVADPMHRGRYLMTDRSVAHVACPQCHAMVAEPCKRVLDGVPRYHSTTHYVRRRLVERTLGRLPDANDITGSYTDRDLSPQQKE